MAASPGARRVWAGLGQGSIRAPHWVGGGVAHGPKPRDYTQRTPKKMRRLALRSALSARASEEAVMVIEDIDWSAPKTKQAVDACSRRSAPAASHLSCSANSTGRAGRSFREPPRRPSLRTGAPAPYDVLWSDQVIFTSHTVGSVGRASSYEVSDSDFVKDDGSEA